MMANCGSSRCTSHPGSTRPDSAPTSRTANENFSVHRAQIDELMGKTQQQSLTLIPVSLYFRDGKAKVQLALAKGRRLYDKRNLIIARDAEREVARATKELSRWGGHEAPRPV